MPIDHNMDVHYQIKHRLYIPWTPNLMPCHFNKIMYAKQPIRARAAYMHYSSPIIVIEKQ